MVALQAITPYHKVIDPCLFYTQAVKSKSQLLMTLQMNDIEEHH